MVGNACGRAQRILVCAKVQNKIINVIQDYGVMGTRGRKRNRRGKGRKSQIFPY